MQAGQSAPSRPRLSQGSTPGSSPGSTPRSSTVAPLFSSLFAPASLSGFLAEVWNRRPLYTAGAAWRSHLRFTLEEFRRALPAFPDVKAQFLGDGRHRETPIHGEQAQDLYDAGLSICVASAERQLPELAAFAARIRDEVRFAGDVFLNCYWSPKGAGFGTHFDAQHVFILQVDGSKRWSISPRRGCDAPPVNYIHSPEGAAAFRARNPDVPLELPDESTFVEHLLQPGDCLYLPPGTWHRTAAGDFSLSISLTLSFVRLEQLLSDVARRLLERSATWRQALPLDGTAAVGITPDWRRFLESRIAEFRSFANALTPELLAEEWLAATLGEADSIAEAPGPELGGEEVLLRQGRLELCPAKDRDGEDAVALLWAGGRCRIPGEYRDFCRRLAAATRFTLEEARRWTQDGTPLDAKDAREVLRQLLRAGLLRRA